jgi:hypothetical protein
VNPAETNPAIRALPSPGPVTMASYSYALSRAVDPDADKGRIGEWRDNTNTQAVILSDRVLKSGNEAAPGESVPTHLQRSTWTTADGDWRGSVVFGDNSTSFLTTSDVPQTRYGEVSNKNDNLFLSTGADDALQFRD